ncbi:MAG TPA: PEP-CTERM sorting domain-containing protein, partial [Pirellulales bacterium]|nr:PEP-CTERM sorting domain-containing protein [Pirellulales bacterium]
QIQTILDVNADGKDNNIDEQALINFLLAGHGSDSGAVPEPTSWLLLGMGAAALLVSRRRKKIASPKGVA